MSKQSTTIKLIKLEEQGEIRRVEIRRSMFPDIEAFMDALDFYEAKGYTQQLDTSH